MSQQQPAPGQATEERVKGIFSSIAGRYDSFNAVASMGIDRSWRRQLVKACAIQPTDRVLDLCAGTGDVALAIAAQAGPAEVIVTDFTPEMLEIAREKGSAFDGRTKLTFQLADAQALPFEDESFDVVTVAFGVRNLPERERNFAEVKRVLRPGGRYVILEFSRPRLAPWRGIYHVYLRHAIPAIGGALTGDREGFVYLNDSIRRFPAQAELAAELRVAGFSAISWRDMTGGVVALHTAVR
ncbi:MAG: bifunctional demethylmenaquinone methyltransferase/2-methoxy-6-polyprenyl-1,4-benzoquinol methylase UbiE [Coriobacteriia bacterium]|nr:bifunctional demethylmenaquinone methyltransferase/2-methoxy-6-polyprenyl-1,4-benzoquinol methylase UbiE [Coriobacteriia bacterium]